MVYSAYGEAVQTELGNTYSIFVDRFFETGTRRLAGSSVLVEGAEHPVSDVSYSYDAAGNPVSVVDDPVVGVGDAQCFAYDGLRRLTQAWTPADANCSAGPSVAGLGGAAPYWFTDSFDQVGNRTSRVVHATGGNTTTTYSYAPGSHRLTSTTSSGPGGAGSSSFTYDEAGNTTTREVSADPAQTLTWDVEGELVEVSSGSTSDTYTYTADGDRLVRRQGGSTTVYLPGGQELTATGSAVRATRYYSFGGQVVAVRTGPGTTGVSTLVADHHGTAGLSIDNTTRAVTRRFTDPYGNPRGAAPATWPGDHGFLDKPTDATGLLAVGARYYDPTTARFVSVDPVMDLADPQQWHGYAYANNNPITWSDPTGLAPMIDGMWGTAKAAAVATTGKYASQGLKSAKKDPSPSSTPKKALKQVVAAVDAAAARGGGPADIADLASASKHERRKGSPAVAPSPPVEGGPGLGACVSISGGFVLFGSISLCGVSFSDYGDIRSYEPVISGTAGWGTPGVNIETGLLQTSARSLQEFTGDSYTTGASAGKGVSFGADVSWAENSQGDMVWSAYESVGFGAYAPYPMEVHGGWTTAERAWRK